MDLSVVIVSYNTCDLLRECLGSVFRETTEPNFEVIVVDNQSADGSAEMVASEYPTVRLLRPGANLGFARACNAAVRKSRGAWILLLNPDTIVHDRALERLLEFGRSHLEAGICGGRTLRPEGAVDPSSCWARPTLWSMACYATGLTTIFRRSRVFDPESMGRWDRDSIRRVDIVTGCLLLSSRDVWDVLGGFDERFFMYGEDADLCLRAAAAGYRPQITPGAEVTHVVGAASATPGWKRQLGLAGKVSLMDKHWSPVEARIGRLLLLGGVGARAGVARVLGRPSPWRDAWRSRRIWRSGWTADAESRLAGSPPPQMRPPSQRSLQSD
jgi:N-acetylglucosaminyl-diphospho-decaprenol L-rhamnosyltransferase